MKKQLKSEKIKIKKDSSAKPKPQIEKTKPSAKMPSITRMPVINIVLSMDAFSETVDEDPTLGLLNEFQP